MKKSALIIANWQYEDPLLRALVSPCKDAASLAQVLGDAAIGGFEVQVLTNVPSYRVCEEAEAFFGDRERDDLLLFYFSGHGITDDEGQLYYAASNTLHKRLRSTAVAATWVNDIMNECRSRRQVMLLDCCHSGAFARTKAAGAVNTGKYFTGATPEEGRGKFILTACDAFQYSFEGEAVEGVGTNSVFTDAIIHGLRTGGADADNDGLVTLDELYDYVFHRVREHTPQQTPRKWASDVEGSVVIAANPNPVEAPLPEDLQAAIDSFVAEVRDKTIPRLDKLLRGKHRGLALSANRALLALAADDSRRVSASAEKCLAAFQRDREAGVVRTDRFEALPVPPVVVSVAADSPRPEQLQIEPSRFGNDLAAEQGSSHASRCDAASAEAPGQVLSLPSQSRSDPSPSAGLSSPKWSSDEDRSAQLRSFGKSLVAKVAEDDTLKQYVAPPAPTRAAAAGTFSKPRNILLTAGGLAVILAIAATGWWALAPGHATSGVTPSSPAVAKPDQPTTDQKRPQPRSEAAVFIPASSDAEGSKSSQDTAPALNTSASKSAVAPPKKIALAKPGALAAPAGSAPAPHTSPSVSSSLPGASTLPSKLGDEPVAAPAAESAASKPSKVIESSDFARAAGAGPPSLHVTLTPEQARALLVSRPAATYPPLARAAGVTGTVVVDTHVSRKGTVLSLEVLDGPPLLRQAALDALKQWRFKPYVVNGDAIEWRTTINIGFILTKE